MVSKKALSFDERRKRGEEKRRYKSAEALLY
jgi:hypothetical protein